MEDQQNEDTGSEEPLVPIMCEICETEAKIPLELVESRLKTHNNRQHDGEEYAVVDPIVSNHLANLIAEDLGLIEK